MSVWSHPAASWWGSSAGRSTAMVQRYASDGRFRWVASVAILPGVWAQAEGVKATLHAAKIAASRAAWRLDEIPARGRGRDAP